MQRFQQINVSDITGKWGVFDNENSLNVIAAIFRQDEESSIWTLQHNMNSDCFIINIFRYIDGIKEMISGYRAEITSLNVITIFFSTPFKGEVELLFFDPINGHAHL